jgi:predicted Rdx family selenoprotein
VRGSGGIFDVSWDGGLLFSKKQAGRFPQPGEVEALLQAHLARNPGQ